MLTTTPSDRAKLPEIMSHPWMTKGFNGPPDNYLPVRKPLQLPLDPVVIDKMTGFDFGPSDLITTQLTKIVDSDDYQRAVRAAERNAVQQGPEVERKRGVFDFYKRRNSTTSRDTLNTPSSEAVQLGNDPINAYSPLISIYNLAAEKIEREAREKNPGALALPTTPGEKPLAVPDLPAPEAAYTNPQAYEMVGEKPTGGRARPRARTHGEDEVREGLAGLNVKDTNPAIVEPEQQQQQQSVKKEGTVAGLLRRVSTRRRDRDSPSERFERTDQQRPGGVSHSHPPPSLAVFGPPASSSAADATTTPRKSFSVRRQRPEREGSQTGLRPETAENKQRGEGLSTPPVPGTGGDGRSDRGKVKTHGLGRSISVNSSDMRRRLSRRGVSEGSSMRPGGSSGQSGERKVSLDPSSRGDAAASSDMEQRPQSGGAAGASRAKSLGHARRGSMQARRARRGDDAAGALRTSDVPEETDQELQEEEEDDADIVDDTGGHGFKPVYLKGVFSVSTTSGKSPQYIRAEIMRVLGRLGVEYTEVKGGFRCRHAPSIKSSVEEEGGGQGGGGKGRKMSFGGFSRGGTAERDTFRSQQRQSSRTTTTSKPSAAAAYATGSEAEDSEPDYDTAPPSHQTSSARAAGETSTHVQSELGNDMVLRFEIFVVKVPLLSLHGVQFKKVEGGTWRYKNMAQTILGEMRL